MTRAGDVPDYVDREILIEEQADWLNEALSAGGLVCGAFLDAHRPADVGAERPVGAIPTIPIGATGPAGPIDVVTPVDPPPYVPRSIDASFPRAVIGATGPQGIG